MPKKPPRNNPHTRELRTIQKAAPLLQRIIQRTGVVEPPAGIGAAAAGTLLERLREGLPPELRPHLLDAMEKSGELVCFVDSAAWAGRLRLAFGEAPELAAGNRISLRVMPREGFRR